MNFAKTEYRISWPEQIFEALTKYERQLAQRSIYIISAAVCDPHTHTTSARTLTHVAVICPLCWHVLTAMHPISSSRHSGTLQLSIICNAYATLISAPPLTTPASLLLLLRFVLNIVLLKTNLLPIIKIRAKQTTKKKRKM